MSCWIHPDDYYYLNINLPSLSQVSKNVKRTNYYSAKGIMQIELRTYQYEVDGKTCSKYYLVLRCNPSIIMGDSKVFLMDMEKYTTCEIIERLQRRLYEINEFRYLQLDKLPIGLFLTNRADIADDIIVERPEIMVWLSNMSFPYKYRNMKRKRINKDIDKLYFESCCFASKSRGFNIYDKRIAMINTNMPILPGDKERLERTLRLEIQVKKRGIRNMKLPTKRSIKPFLDKDFCHGYLEKEIRSVFGVQKYVSRNKAVEIINASQYKPYEKAVMLSIIDMIQQYYGLYNLEQAIDNENVYTTPQYGNLRSFREHWLSKIRKLGISPVVIPDKFGIEEVLSIHEILTAERREAL